MPLTEVDRAKIIAQQNSFLDSQFGGLDLSGFPHLQQPRKPVADKFEPREDGPVQSIRDFVSNIDGDTLQQLAEQHGGDFVATVREQRGEEAVRQFKANNPDYVVCQENFENLITTLATQHLKRDDGDAGELTDQLIDAGAFTPAHLQAAWRELKAQGLAELPAGTAKELSQSEKLHVARLAQAGNTEAAIESHLRFAVGDDIGTEILSDPAYGPACDRAVWDCWQLATTDFSYTTERQQFISRFVGSRPLTLHLLNAAWTECKRSEERFDRNATLGLIEEQAALPAPQLDELSDDGIDSLYHGSLRQYAKEARRGVGVLA